MKEKEVLDYIFLDQEGYNKYIEKTKQLKSDYDTISTLISKIVLEGRKEDADTDYESLMMTRKNLKQTIEAREKEEQRIKIVSRNENSEFLDIGAVVRVSLEYPNGNVEEDTFELVADDNDFDCEISKISVNTPLGKCVYRKNIGDLDSFTIREGKVLVKILEKVNVKILKKTDGDL